MRFVKRVNDRGTITLPAEIRSVLDIREGDIVEFEIHRVVPRGLRRRDVHVEIGETTAKAEIPVAEASHTDPTEATQ